MAAPTERRHKKPKTPRAFVSYPPDWDTMTDAERDRAAELMAEAIQAALLPKRDKRRI